MEKIIEGLRSFVRTMPASERSLYQRLATGQEPDALFITCSDSRVSPNRITQASPGELFILRNVGNLVPPYGPSHAGPAAAVEYAIEALGVDDLIVCGHEDCGAMKALVEPKGLEGLPAVRDWLEHARLTRELVRSQFGDRSFEEQLRAAIEINVLLQLENLRSHPSVARALAEGRLGLHGWVFEIESGHVRAFCSEEKGFRSLSAEPC